MQATFICNNFILKTGRPGVLKLLAEDHLNCMMDREALPGNCNCSFRGMRGQRKSKQKRIEPPSFFHIFHLFYDDVIYKLQNNTTQCHLEALDGNESGRRVCPANLESLD